MLSDWTHVQAWQTHKKEEYQRRGVQMQHIQIVLELKPHQLKIDCHIHRVLDEPQVVTTQKPIVDTHREESKRNTKECHQIIREENKRRGKELEYCKTTRKQ